MYIWNTKKLAAKIKDGNVGQGERKKYYLAVSIFITLTMYLNILFPRYNMSAVLVEVIATIGILIFGVSITYQSNQGDNGIDYISRVTALSFPIMIKLFLLSFLGGLLIGILSETMKISVSIMEWFIIGFTLLIHIIYFWRINIYMKHINS